MEAIAGHFVVEVPTKQMPEVLSLLSKKDEAVKVLAALFKGVTARHFPEGTTNEHRQQIRVEF